MISAMALPSSLTKLVLLSYCAGVCCVQHWVEFVHKGQEHLLSGYQDHQAGVSDNSDTYELIGGNFGLKDKFRYTPHYTFGAPQDVYGASAQWPF